MNELQNSEEAQLKPDSKGFKISLAQSLIVAILIILSLLVPGILIGLPVRFWPDFYHISLPLSFLAGGLLGIFILTTYLNINWSTISEHLKTSPNFWLIPLSILLYFFSLPLAEFLSSIVPTSGNWIIEELYKSTTQAFEVMLDYKGAGFLTVCVLAPIFEEILFRGILFRGMLQYGMNPIFAILISSILFGIAHMNPWQFLGAGVLGAIFAFIYYRTKSLWICIFLHALNNTISFFMMIQMESIEENITNPNNSISVVFSILVAISMGFSIYKLTPQIKWN